MPLGIYRGFRRGRGCLVKWWGGKIGKIWAGSWGGSGARVVAVRRDRRCPGVSGGVAAGLAVVTGAAWRPRGRAAGFGRFAAAPAWQAVERWRGVLAVFLRARVR